MGGRVCGGGVSCAVMDVFQPGIALGIVFLVVAAILFALLLRWARCAGWPIIGGLLAGIILGPTIFGRLQPTPHEQLFVGSVEERRALDDLLHEMNRDLVVAGKIAQQTETQPDQSIQELNEKYQEQVAQRETALHRAHQQDQLPYRWLTVILISAVFLGHGLLSIPQRDSHHGWTTPISVGLGAAILPLTLGYLTLTWLFDFTLGTSSVTGGLLALSTLMIGPWMMTPADRKAADQAEVGGSCMMQRAGRVSSCFALLTVVYACAVIGDRSICIWMLPLLIMVLSWLLPGVGGRVGGRGLFDVVLLPILAAIAIIRIDLFDSFSFWLMILFVLISGDGRWLGAVFGALIPGGRRILRPMRLVLGSMACGPTQLAIVALGVQLEILPHVYALALLFGVVYIELTAPLRRSFAQILIKTESQLDELEGEE